MALIFTLLTQLINLTSFTLHFQVDDDTRLLPVLPPGKVRFAKPSRVLRHLGELRDERPGWKIRIFLDGGFTGIELDPRVILVCVRVVFHIDLDRVLRVYGARESCIDYLLRHRYFGCMRNYFWNARTLASIDRSDTEFATKSRNKEGHCQWLAPWVDTHTTSPATERYAPQEKSRRKETPPVIVVVGKKIESSPSLYPASPSPNRSPQQERSNMIFDPQPLKNSNEEIFFENNPSMNDKKDVQQQQKRLRDDPPPLTPPDPTGGLVDREDSFSSTDGVNDSFVHVFLFVLAFIAVIILFL